MGAPRPQFAASADDPAVRADKTRLKEVLRLRQGKLCHARRRADPPTRARAELGGVVRALGLLLPALDVADLGCGDGYLTIEAARWAQRVVAVDRVARRARRARARWPRGDASNITWKRGELEALPLEDESVDVALLSQALHHAEDPARALAEAARISGPAVACSCSTSARTIEALGARAPSATAGWDSMTADARDAAERAPALRRRAESPRRALKTGYPFTVLVASGQKA